MLNQYAVDNPTLPVNLAFFPHFSKSWRNAKPFSGNAQDAAMDRQVLVTRMVYRETFLEIQWRLLQHLIRKSQILGSLMYQNTHHHM